MLHAERPKVRALLLKGNYGLEKESLRVDEEGFLSHTSHPFPNDDHIVRDFCENQTEINTSVTHSAAEAVQALAGYDRQIQKVLAFEREKFVDADNRYAWKIRREFDGGFVKKGLALARQRQEEADV